MKRLKNFKLGLFLPALLMISLILTACGDSASPTGTSASTATAGTTSDGFPLSIDPAKINTTINGSGSTLVAPAVQQWQVDFASFAPNLQLKYLSLGSGQGRKDFLSGKTDFGGSDIPVTAEEIPNGRSLDEIVQIPWTLAAVVLAFNLEGVNDLNLSSQVVCDIYSGKITRWDDPKLKQDNPSVNFPANEINLVVRADNSGTSQVFTSYLSSICPDFKSKIGISSQPNWESAGLKVNPVPQNAGVAGLIKLSPGMLGYVELSYAVDNELGIASLKNPAGKFVKPSLESTSAAINNNITLNSSAALNLLNQTGDNTYPIVTTSYVLLNKNYADKAKGQTLLSFVWYALHQGQARAKSLSFAPLPDTIIKQAEAKLKTITSGSESIIR